MIVNENNNDLPVSVSIDILIFDIAFSIQFHKCYTIATLSQIICMQAFAVLRCDVVFKNEREVRIILL